jgi:hypothetical protein
MVGGTVAWTAAHALSPAGFPRGGRRRFFFALWRWAAAPFAPIIGHVIADLAL